MMTRADLPSFDKPPVVETVLGVQFDPLPKFTNAHLGAFWETLGNDWPFVADAPPLNQEFERFGKEQVWSRLALKFSVEQAPATRLQIRNRDQSRMIQIQNGRLHYNWLGHDGAEYARYAKIREEFTPLVGKLESFLNDREVGDFSPNQWEVTYVNHLPRGTLWDQPSDWNKVFASPVALLNALPNSEIESFSGQWHFAIKTDRGRLHVDLQHGREEKGGKGPMELLIFKLTARGPVMPDKAGWGWPEGLELGHGVIVRSFERLTSEAARNIWKQR